MNTTRTSLFLMANLGSEVSRVLSSRERGDEPFARESLERAEHILNDIKKLPDMRERTREMELLSCAIREPRVFPEHLRSYFEPFALRLVAS